MKSIRVALSVAGGVASLLLARSLLEPYGLSEEHHDAAIPNLPASWEGQKIVLLCDLHVGMRGGPPSTVRRAVKRAIHARPAAVLIAGDFIHDRAQAIDDAVELLGPLLNSGIPVYAVLGNHDYAMPTKDATADWKLARCLEGSLEAAGVRVLHNEAVELRAVEGEQPLYLVGIGAHTARDDQVAEALSGVPSGAARVVMMHHPASFDQCPAGSAPFAVAGHTHGGQVRLPLAPILNYLTYSKELKVIVSGWIHADGIQGYGKTGNHLYVSRGIGCSVLPMRLFCPPEFTVFTLRSAA
ncbi:MAG: metallophosphoesterase [Trueperaceae bacterium]